jgi:predicted ester cyclase
MSTEPMEQVKQFVAAFNEGNLESIQQHIANDFFNYSPTNDEPSATEVTYQLAAALKAALPDLSITVDSLAAEGDLLKGQITFSGTHTGELWGAPGRGNHVTWTVPVTIRFKNGAFAVNFDDLTPPDMLGVARQLNFVPPPEDMDKPPKYPIVIPEFIMQVIFTGQASLKACSHLEQIQVTEPTTDVCEACVALGDEWPALRMCLTCGYVGCCDTSIHKHMKQHYEETGHSLFRSIRMDEGWLWCYEHNAFFPKRILENYR